jgi:hypothetical protein
MTSTWSSQKLPTTPTTLSSNTTMSSKAAGKKRAAPDIDLEGDDNEIAINNNEAEEGTNAEGGPSTTTTAVKPKTKSKTSSKKRKPTLIPGIVYISRLPPGMTPQKVKYLMAQWGDIGKIYAQKRDGECLFLVWS